MAGEPALQRLGGPVEPEHYHLAAEKLLAGNPLQTIWMEYSDASGLFFAGLWASETGKWRIAYTEEEHCRILDGESVITGADGIPHPVRAGDVFVIPRGFTGTWEVVTPTRKAFVIYEAGAALPEGT